MNLSAPKNITFWLAVLLAVLGVIFQLTGTGIAYSFWLVVVGFVLLALGNLSAGL